MRGGGTEVYGGFDSSTGSYTADKQTLATLVRIPQSDGSSSVYEKRFPDGSKEIFSHPDALTSYPRLVFLTSVVDAAGNSVTVTYHSDGSLRITGITDSAGNPPTTFSYAETGDIFRIIGVTDPFGRAAGFEYNASGKLTKITDPIGIESQFEYENNSDFIKKLTTPYGSTTFATGEGGNSARWLGVTDPLGGKERVEYMDSAPIPSSETSSPMGVYNNDLEFQNTFYWDKKAMAEAPGEYSKAQIFHWLATPDGKISGIKHSEKKALESRVWYTYSDQNDPAKVGKNALPIKVARIVDGGATQLSQYSYNPLGNLLKETDPVDRVKSYAYDPANNIDVLRVYQRNPAGTSTDPDGWAADKISESTYNSLHKPLTVTDAAGQPTTFTYNTNGQILTRTNARYETTTYAYGGTVPEGYLASITGPLFNNESPVTSFGYDSFHRVRTVINEADDYTVTTDYDELDRKTGVTYPDNTFEEFKYTQVFEQGQPPRKILDLTESADRMGRWIFRHYNGNRQMDSITDPENRTTHYNWCTCGSLTGIVDGNSNLTTFVRDLQSRVTTKIFADGTPNSQTLNYVFENTTSRLKSITDALNRRTNYFYYGDNNISQVSYTGTSGNSLIPSTPSVNYTYDPNYNRVMSIVTSGVGSIDYTYYPIAPAWGPYAGRLRTVHGSVANDTITFTYDELGRMLGQSIDGVTETVAYDALGRLTTTDNALGHFDREYDGVTPRLQTLTYPIRQTANYNYFGNDHDRRLQTIQNLAGEANLSQFDYTYDPEGQITSWSKLLNTTASGLWFDYDNAMQLRSARNASNPNASTRTLDYGYDDAGNRTSDRNYNPNGWLSNGTSNSYGVNGLNQVETLASMADGALAGDPQVFVYDAVGNLTDDGARKSFEWDAANRLVAINYADTGNRTEFAYDGLGRRVKITEYGPGVTAEVEPVDENYATFVAGPFTLPSGGCTLTLKGLNSRGGDNTMLIDSVTLDNVLLANGSFESPSVTDYQDNPTGTAWSFIGSAGVAANGGTYTSDNPNAPLGNQVAFVRNSGSLSQTWSVSAGSYTLGFEAAQRGSGNDAYQQLRVTLRSLASVNSVKTFVWCGNRICEERDGNNNVTKRFFAEGFQTIDPQLSTTNLFYYTLDHLGSIREVTDSAGSLKAQYDYDPYGNRVALSGQMDIDFGYTGHYFHAPSGLNLTLYRAYNPALGRWLSTDPIAEDGGLNLYAYINNDPVNQVDTLGLQGMGALDNIRRLWTRVSQNNTAGNSNNTYWQARQQCELAPKSPGGRCKCCVVWILAKHTYGDNVESKGGALVYDKPCDAVRDEMVYESGWTPFTFYIPW